MSSPSTPKPKMKPYTYIAGLGNDITAAIGGVVDHALDGKLERDDIEILRLQMTRMTEMFREYAMTWAVSDDGQQFVLGDFMRQARDELGLLRASSTPKGNAR